MKSPSYPNPDFRKLTKADGVPRCNGWYRFSRKMLQIGILTWLQFRAFGRHHAPAKGSVIFIANHQSFLDPMMVGMCIQRPMNFMARDSLFRNKIFAWMISSVYAFPVRRGTADVGAMKEAMRRLKKGGQVLLFAEGTRTKDGRIAKFLPGVALLAQRSAQWTVPVMLEGAYDAWPKTQLLPSRGHMIVRFGRPIPQSEAKKLKPAEFVESVRQSIITMQHETRLSIGKEMLKYD